MELLCGRQTADERLRSFKVQGMVNRKHTGESLETRPVKYTSTGMVREAYKMYNITVVFTVAYNNIPPSRHLTSPHLLYHVIVVLIVLFTHTLPSSSVLRFLSEFFVFLEVCEFDHLVAPCRGTFFSAVP